MRNVAIGLAAILFVGCAERPPGNVQDVLTMRAPAKRVPVSGAAAARSGDAKYDPSIIGLDIATTSEYSANAAPSSLMKVQSAQAIGPAKNPTSPRRHPVTPTTEPTVKQGDKAHVVSGKTEVAVDGAGSNVRVDGDRSGGDRSGGDRSGDDRSGGDRSGDDRSGIKAPPARELYDPDYPKPSFVKPDELSQRQDTTAAGQGTSPTLYPTRGQAAQNNDSPTLYPPSGRFSDPGSPSLYPQGPTAPRGFRGQ